MKPVTWLVLFFTLCCSELSHSHALSPSFLNLIESQDGQFQIFWQPSKDVNSKHNSVAISYPQACANQGKTLHCAESLAGKITFDGLPLHAEVIVRVQYLTGGSSTDIITGEAPELVIASSTDDGQNHWQIVQLYSVLGGEHIVFGYDHLLFVFGLLLMVGFRHKLLLTITAFTVAHSITLALSMVTTIPVLPRYVEIIIALSIVLVAVEALRNKPSFSFRHPSIIAFAFGLIHGLGFAGALKDIGLPEGAFALSLLAFNVGVELGQVAVLLALFALYKIAGFIGQLSQIQSLAKQAAGYGIGAMGTFWFVERLVA